MARSKAPATTDVSTPEVPVTTAEAVLTEGLIANPVTPVTPEDERGELRDFGGVSFYIKG